MQQISESLHVSKPFPNYAGVGPRSIACVIDSIVSFILSFVIALVIYFIVHKVDKEMFGSILLIVHMVYVTAMTSSQLKATVGKFFCGLQVTDEDGDQLSIAQAFLREIIKIIPLCLLISVPFVAILRKKTALYDMAAGTIVIVDPKL